MDVSRRRGGVVAGSVWESRMKSNEVRGGIKVSNAEENAQEGGNGGTTSTRLQRNQLGGAGKRKTWKSETQKNCEEQCKKLSVSSDGIKKSPIQGRKPKNEGRNEIGASTSGDKFERSPIQTRKLRSETLKEGQGGESCDVPERNSVQLRKSKSDSIKTASQCVKNAAGCGNRNGENSIQLRKTKSELDRVSDESRNGVDDGIAGGCEQIEVENWKDDPDESCKDFGVCQEKVISSSSDNVGTINCSPELSVQQVDGGDSDAVVIDDEADEGDEEEEEVDEEIEIEIEIEMEKESFDVKEISIPESKVVKEPENGKVLNEPEKVVETVPENKKVENQSEKRTEAEKKVVVSVPENKQVVNEPEKKKKNVVNEPEPKKVVSAHTRFHQKNERTVSVPLALKQSPPIRRHSAIYQNFSKANSIPKAEEYHSFPQTQNKLQSLVDLIMWRDVSRSAFIFGIGTFITVSSSYAKDINLSLISVMSYISLVYLAVIFLYRSLICRGVIVVEDTNYVLGEEEAKWVLKLILPYLNEFLSKLRALFSGDPGTTIKLAVLLFVLARCGSSITIWKMAKFGFFGVFTVPKFCSLYSAQLTAYGNFWIRRFRDAWDSCSHKKAVALGIFGLVWNLSSVVARIWAVFMLFVAFRYYQQHYLVRDEWVEDEAGCDETWQEPVGVAGQKQPGFAEINKVKKGY